MTLPPQVSHDEWRAARTALLADEKAHTRAGDALSARRREMPMVALDKDYKLEGTEGSVGLVELFAGHPQLVVQHFMFDPAWRDGCPHCTYAVHNLFHLPHLAEVGVSFALVSRAPLDRLLDYRERMGWTVPWYSSHDSDFNYDFGVTMDDQVTPAVYNYRSRAEHEENGAVGFTAGEQPGVSVFLRDGDRVFHTYSAYARGGEPLVSALAVLDLTPFGRTGPVSG